MKLLYPLLLSGVLLLTSCEQSEAPSSDVTDRSENIEAGNPRGDTSRTSPSGKSEDPLYRVVFLGDSITAGFGVDEIEAFPYLLQLRSDEVGLPVEFVNSGFSGDTSTGGLSRIDWVLRNRADVLVVELGGNDGLRGIDLSLTKSNLMGIIDHTLQKYPDCIIIVAGMMVPPSIGHEYTARFRAIFPEIAEHYDAVLIPFILEGVGGVRELNQPDGIHPTAEGHQIIAQTVWSYLEPIMASFPKDRTRLD